MGLNICPPRARSLPVVLDFVFVILNLFVICDLFFGAFQRHNSRCQKSSRRGATTMSVRKSAFTLVELLIVVVIMAILAGRAAPNLIDASTDAKMSVMLHDEDALKSAIARYRGEHRSISPSLIAGTLPQLINKTDRNGNIGTTSAYPYGPYLNEIPANAVNGVATIVATTAAAPSMTNKTGWHYNEPMGRIWGGLRTTGITGGGGGS